MFELGNIAGADSLWRVTPQECGALKPEALKWQIIIKHSQTREIILIWLDYK